MPAHNAVRINGTMPGGEVWSVNPRFWSPTSGSVVDYAELQEWADDIAAVIAGWPSTNALLVAMSSALTVTSVRVEALSSVGTLIQAAESILATPKAGQGSPTKPYQTAVVTSLLTGRPGRSYRGRLYWPAQGAAMSTSDLRISGTACQAIADAMGAFLTDVAELTPGGVGVRPVVVSQTVDVATPVTSVSVGNIFDVQRRRRDSLDEARFTRVIPYNPA